MIPISKPWLGQEEKDAVMKVLDSGIIASGPKVKEFEKNFATYIGTTHALMTSSGTTSLHAALFAFGIGKGDQVITTAFTFIATANSILYAGAEPIFADIDADTFNISPVAVEKLLKKDIFHRIKAIMVVHLYGQTCDMDTINALAKKYKLVVIEDAAQAHGAKYKGKKAGGLSDAGSFSFYATKNMATGEGGGVTTDDSKADAKMRVFINHGMEQQYFHTMLGYNYRMTDIEAAIGLEQLKKIDNFNEIRRANADKLKRILGGYNWLVMPAEREGNYHIYHQFALRVKNGLRDNLLKYLTDKGIGCKIFYPIAVHEQPLYKKLLKRKVIVPEVDIAVKEVLNVPIHPQLDEAYFKLMDDACKDFSKTI